MFVANTYVSLYRASRPILDEMDISEDPDEQLIYVNMPIHITPFRPRYQVTNDNRIGQQTKLIANIRKNYSVLQRDRLVASNGRTFIVSSVEGTGGAFMDNSIVLELTEVDASV